MKKIVLSLASVLAATAFAPEASAVPAFARQTGMACTACHAQHFPVLNGFGRAFKAGGYTMMGSQGKVEGEHLSIPDTLNASIVMKIRYQDDNTAGSTLASDQTTQTMGDGQWQFFDEFALLFGGRVAENVGFLLEAQMNATAPLAAGFKMPFVFDVGAAKLSVIPFQTDALDVTYGYELSSGGIQRANRWSEGRRDISAFQYNADRGINAGAATGIAFVAQNDMGYVNYTKWAATQMNGGLGSDMDSNYFRIAATPTVGDWTMVVGLGTMTGSSYAASAATPAKVDTEQDFFDLQAQGQVGGKELSVYAQYARADATVSGNAYNSSKLVAGCGAAGGTSCASARKAWSIGADYSVIPHVLTVGLGYRSAETGNAISAAHLAAGRGTENDAVIFTAVYDLYQNVALHLNYADYSGNDLNRPAGSAAPQDSLVTLMLEASW